jgi:hypothetical protein
MPPVVIADGLEGQSAGWVHRSFTVECDEVYVVAGHKGNPEAVKKRASRAATPVAGGAGPRHAGQGEAADLRHCSKDTGSDCHAARAL